MKQHAAQHARQEPPALWGGLHTVRGVCHILYSAVSQHPSTLVAPAAPAGQVRGEHRTAAASWCSSRVLRPLLRWPISGRPTKSNRPFNSPGRSRPRPPSSLTPNTYQHAGRAVPKDSVFHGRTHDQLPALRRPSNRTTCLTCARRSRASIICGVIPDVPGSSRHLTSPSDRVSPSAQPAWKSPQATACGSCDAAMLSAADAAMVSAGTPGGCLFNHCDVAHHGCYRACS